MTETDKIIAKTMPIDSMKSASPVRINLPKFRLVSYQCEVSEKIRIFESGLNDYMIEYIKYKHFDKKYFMWKHTINETG